MPETTRTAKGTFLRRHETEAKSIADTLTGKPFEVACDYALLELGEELPNAIDVSAQAQIVGARRVLQILQSITTPDSSPKTRSKSLNYGALQ